MIVWSDLSAGLEPAGAPPNENNNPPEVGGVAPVENGAGAGVDDADELAAAVPVPVPFDAAKGADGTTLGDVVACPNIELPNDDPEVELDPAFAAPVKENPPVIGAEEELMLPKEKPPEAWLEPCCSAAGAAEAVLLTPNEKPEVPVEP